MGEFLKALRKSKREWRVGQTGLIRAAGKCPIEAVGLGDDPWMGQSLWDTGRKLGLRPDAISRIMSAADARGHHPRTRAKLLEACGLTEGATP